MTDGIEIVGSCKEARTLEYLAMPKNEVDRNSAGQRSRTRTQSGGPNTELCENPSTHTNESYRRRRMGKDKFSPWQTVTDRSKAGNTLGNPKRSNSHTQSHST